jgi:zinc D-Ala-D-Ala carboxypeptidase
MRLSLSKNFTLKELTRSNTALRLGIDNTPSKEGIYKLTLLATNLLQPIRERLGALRVTSGYRSAKLSEAIGGAYKIIDGKYVATSQHCRYEAVDIQYVKRGQMDNNKIYKAVIEGAIEFDQMILEFGTSTEYIDGNPDWVHLSYEIDSKENRRQILVAYKDENNKTKYRTKLNYYSI